MAPLLKRLRFHPPHAALQQRRRSLAQVDQDQRIQGVREIRIHAEAEHAAAGFQVLTDQHRDTFAVVFNIRDESERSSISAAAAANRLICWLRGVRSRNSLRGATSRVSS